MFRVSNFLVLCSVISNFLQLSSMKNPIIVLGSRSAFRITLTAEGTFFSCWFLLNLTLGVWFHLQFMWYNINHTQIDDNQLFIYWLNHLSIYITDIMNFLTTCVSYSPPHEVIDLIYLRSMLLRMGDTNLPLTTLCVGRRL